MQEPVEYIKAVSDTRPFIISLLDSEKLPVRDLPPVLKNFFVAIVSNRVIGVIGLEEHGDCGLLRSMVVSKEFRARGVASQLIDRLEAQAQKLGLHCIYLLTETAAAYFERRGYRKLNRDDVPVQIRSSTEFSSVCPASAIVMKKDMVSRPI